MAAFCREEAFAALQHFFRFGQFADPQKKSLIVCFLECQIKSRSNSKTERSNLDFYKLCKL
jgi:hypothetical protein